MSSPMPIVWSQSMFESRTNPKRKRKKLKALDGELEAWGMVERVGDGPHKGQRPAAAARAHAQALQPGYALERSDFLRQKQNMNAAGTQMSINPAGGSFVHDTLDKGGWLGQDGNPDQYPQNIRDILAKNFNALSDHEFPTVTAYFKQMGYYKGGHEASVHYVRKDERVKELICVVDAHGRIVQKGVPCHFNWAMWAMDEYGNFICQPTPGVHHQGPAGTGQWNHSSLNAGKDVMCAGVVSFQNGFVQYINNESGHYAPSATMLANALAVLAEEGADLDHVNSIELHPGRVPFPDAATFLAAHPAE